MRQSIVRVISLLLLFSVAMVGCGKLSADSAVEKMVMAEEHVLERNYDKAVIAYKDALLIDPSLTDAYLGLAKIYLLLDSPDEAINKALLPGLEHVEGNSLKIFLAGLYAELGNTSESVSLFFHLLEDENDKEVWSELEEHPYIHEALIGCYLENNEKEKALGLAERLSVDSELFSMPLLSRVLWRHTENNFSWNYNGELGEYGVLVNKDGLFFSAFSGDDYACEELVALDLKTGSVSWRYPIEDLVQDVHRLYSLDEYVLCGNYTNLYLLNAKTGERKSASFSQEDLWFEDLAYSTLEGTVIARNAITAKEVWRRELPEAADTMRCQNGLLLVSAGDLYALDLRSGKTVFVLEINDMARQLSMKDEVLVFLEGSSLVAINAETSTRLWQLSVPTGYYQWTDGIINVGDVILYRVLELDSTLDTDDQVFADAIGTLVAIDTKSGKTKWRYAGIKGYNLYEAGHFLEDKWIEVSEEIVLALDAKGRLIALDISSGKLLWVKDNISQFIARGKYVYCSASDNIWALELRTGKIARSIVLSEEISDIKIYDGVLFATSGEYLYAIE